MDDQFSHPTDAALARSIAIASELNNVLQIISGTGAVIEGLLGSSSAAEKHFSVLRTSVDRAAQLTSTLTDHGVWPERKIVTYPAASAHATPPAPKRASKPAAAPRILIVDDEVLSLELAKEVFAEAGFEATTAQSGFECIDRVRTARKRYDLVLLDLSMPFMDGEETFKRLRDMVPNIAVMLNTGFVAPERLERMINAGLAGYIRKPHRPSELVAQVRSVLQSVRLNRAGCAAFTRKAVGGDVAVDAVPALTGTDICR